MATLTLLYGFVMRNETVVEIRDADGGSTYLRNFNDFGYVQAYSILRAADAAAKDLDASDAVEELRNDDRLSWSETALEPDGDTWVIDLQESRPGPFRPCRSLKVRVGRDDLGLLDVEDFRQRAREYRHHERS